MRRVLAMVSIGMLYVTLFAIIHSGVTAEDDSSTTTVECGAILGTLRTPDIKSKLQSSPNVPSSAAGYSMILIKHHVQARKICGSCRNKNDNVDNVDNVDSSTGTAREHEYCVESAYGYNATVSGLLLLPIDEDGELVEGPMTGHIAAHQSLTETFSQIPSGTSVVNEGSPLFNNHWLSIVAASSGKIAIAPDYLGYGESANFFKSFLIRPAYAMATLPLWQSTVKMIAEESNCRSYLKPFAYVTGYGEGAYAALSIADALYSTLQVQIVKTNVGGGPYRMGSLAIPRLLDSINEKQMSSDHYHLLALLASAYSSTNTWQANYGQDQDLLDPTYRDRIVALVHEGGTPESILESLPPKVTDMINPGFFHWIKSMVVQGDYRGCLAAIADDDGSSTVIPTTLNVTSLCLALLENDLTNLLQDAEYDIDLCHSPNDEVFHIDNLPPQLRLNADDTATTTIIRNNPRLSRQLASGSHDSAYSFCSQLAITQGLFTNPPRVGAIAEECTFKPTTLQPLEIPPTNTPIAATWAPTPKPTTRLVEAVKQASSASNLGNSSCFWIQLLVMSLGMAMSQ
ncbi:MAG: hypothetical protein SGBAC_009978 [Bacillariaceae sp.]